MVPKISRDVLKTMLDRQEPVILVEALPEMYYRKAHLPGAINIPHDRVDELAPRLLPDKAAAIVVYRASAPCKNSGAAAARPLQLGYAKVRDYHEGMQDWIEAGLRVETRAATAA